ncbi:MAG TPA: hypothetical protein VN649_22425 [Ramlibacter sp.]|nr:hypothetical protein [Ramlibacter sp.]
MKNSTRSSLPIILSLPLWAGSPAVAQVSVAVAVPGVSIGINMPVYPEFVRVPNYPVYYAPRLQTNYFFYDGIYWVYQQDNWYRSSWYNGPWALVSPQAVPVYVLRIPVRYYRNPPTYFRGWQLNAPPRWGEHWGNGWAQQRSGWDHWDRRASLAPAPLPVYQRQYSGNRYPHVEQQQALHSRNYRYQPRDAVVRQHVQQPVAPVAVAPSRQQQAEPNRIPDQQPRPALQNRPQQQGAERRDPQVQAASPGAEHGQRQGQGQGQGRGDSQSKGHEQDRDEDSTGRQHKR